jgi:hypothetical protein
MSDYNQGVQDILSSWAQGKIKARQARNAMRKLGYTADFREVGESGEIQVFPISDETVSGEFYGFRNGGAVKGGRMRGCGSAIRGTKFKGVF